QTHRTKRLSPLFSCWEALPTPKLPSPHTVDHTLFRMGSFRNDQEEHHTVPGSRPSGLAQEAARWKSGPPSRQEEEDDSGSPRGIVRAVHAKVKRELEGNCSRQAGGRFIVQQLVRSIR